MASLPGFPGNLGMPPSGNPSNSDSSFDLPSSGISSPILLANRTYSTEFADPIHGLDLSGSFSIPATTKDNLLIVFVTGAGVGTFGGTGTVSDNASDVFTQVPWYSIAGSNAVAGQMSVFTSTIHDPSNPSNDFQAYSGVYDAWYTVTKGGATSISWAYTDDLRGAGFTGPIGPEFWVYELSGTSGTWSLVTTGASTTGLTDVPGGLPPPFVGPSLNGTSPQNVYFSIIGAGDAFNEGALDPGSVALPWILDNDPGFGALGLTFRFGEYGQALAYILDSTGTQQGVFNTAGGFEDDFVCCGVVFGCGGVPASGDIDQPNVCVPTA